MADTIEIKAIGFSGFYEGIWDQGDNEYNAIECERSCGDEGFGNLQLLDDWGFAPNYREQVAELYGSEYVDLVNETLGLNLKLISQEIWSPKEYNFENDKFFLTCEVEDKVELCDKLRKIANLPKNYKWLKDTIYEYHSSCDGFWSWMSNDIEDWFGLIYTDDQYLMYLIAYLVQVCGGDLGELNAWVYSQAQEDGLHTVEPTTPEAKEEYELFQKYGTIYTDWAEEHPKRYETGLSFPCFKETPWDEYEADFLEYGEPVWLRREINRNHPVIPGLE